MTQEERQKDERIRKEIIETFKILGDGKIPVDINYADIFTWLEKQGDHKFAWSEEDENHIQHISDFIMRNRVGDTDAIYRLEQDVNWLKSLKDRYTWKPSEKQMRMLHRAIKVKAPGVVRDGLESLYNDLKNL